MSSLEDININIHYRRHRPGYHDDIQIIIIIIGLLLWPHPHKSGVTEKARKFPLSNIRT